MLFTIISVNLSVAFDIKQILKRFFSLKNFSQLLENVMNFIVGRNILQGFYKGLFELLTDNKCKVISTCYINSRILYARRLSLQILILDAISQVLRFRDLLFSLLLGTCTFGNFRPFDFILLLHHS